VGFSRTVYQEKGSMAHIFVVDDDPDVVATITDAFLMFGHSVTSAKNGVQALEMFHNNYFDIAIIDVEMPLMNGLELTRELKKFRESFPIVLITGYSHLYQPQDVLSLDVEAFLKKPLNLQNLVSIVEQILSRPGA